VHRGRSFLVAALPVFMFLVTIPLFFDILRSAAFNTAPRDDYGPYLQSIVGQGGGLPGAPMVYRPLSVAVAVPFYFLLPIYYFSELTDVDPYWYRATEALAAVSYLSLLATAGVIFLICQKKLGATVKSSLLVALLSLVFSGFISQEGIDPICVLIISLLVYLIDRPWIFSVLLLLSMGFNEKIAFLFAIILGLRIIVGRDRSMLPQVCMSAVAVLGYFAVRILVNAPGNENQMTPSSFLPSVVAMLPFVFSWKGLFTNLVPTFVIGALAWLDLWTVNRLGIDSAVWRKPDVFVFVLMFVMGLAARVGYTDGRLVMLTYPLYLPVLSRTVDAWFPDRERSVAVV
jgi:hypothetical protein